MRERPGHIGDVLPVPSPGHQGHERPRLRRDLAHGVSPGRDLAGDLAAGKRGRPPGDAEGDERRGRDGRDGVGADTVVDVGACRATRCRRPEVGVELVDPGPGRR